jgi:asparagine synthase (glutamine-hydrolysing)
MCGIAGALNSNARIETRKLIGDMIASMSHRGPDGDGIYVHGPVGLGHRRLSIIDAAGGSQPMHNEDRSIWITFNGEIFNYIELTSDLVKHGHRFASRSDTEVILHLYEEYGHDCVRFLNGQWAFAMWDSNRQELFLSRDRLGVRPLFYTQTTANTFLFASEIKALFTCPDVRREIDLIALDDLFTFWHTSAPRTIFRGINELAPGHSMVVRKDHECSVLPHWRLSYPTANEWSNDANGSEADYADEIYRLLVDATRIRLRSDVPVGAYLSGGLDSTITTALIRSAGNSKLKTFSVTFEDPEFDERAYQRDAANFFGTDHHDICCSEEDIARVFPDVIWHTEQPILRTAPAPLYMLSRSIHQAGLRVALTGEGSDEVFGGYDIFKETKIRRFWLVSPQSQTRPLLLRRLYPYLNNVQAQPDAYLRSFFRIAPGGHARSLFSHLPRWELTAKNKAFFSDSVKEKLRGRDAYAQLDNQLPSDYSNWHWFCQAQYLEAHYLLPGYILSSQGDRVAMAHAVEGRFPFLDHRVVEFAATVPPRLKMKVLNEKYLLKRAFGKLIPPSIEKRAKQPYRSPEGRCFFALPANNYVEELLAPARLQQDGLFDATSVQRLVEKFRQGHAIGIRDNMALVGILSSQLVVNQFINHFPRRQDAVHRTASTSICD